MKKKDYITLVLTIIGLLLFGLGMSMALVAEWNMLKEGIIVGIIGALVLLAMVLIRRKMEGKPRIKISLKTVGIVTYTIISSLVFGTGLCMVLLEKGMINGIIIGIVGIVMILGLIPMVKGFKD